MNRVFRMALALICIFAHVQPTFASDTRERSEDIPSLIQKIMAAYGGEKAVEGTTVIHAVGDINAIMRHDQGSYELIFMRPGKLRVDTKYKRSFETRLLNGDKGYRGTNEAPLAQVKDERFLAMVYQYKHFDVLYGLLHGLYSVRVKGKEELNGSSVAVLHCSDQEGPPMDVYIDVRTGYIVKVTGYFAMGEGRATTLSSEFSDFNKVAGMVFPFKVVNYADGRKIAETSMKTYFINQAVPASVFAP